MKKPDETRAPDAEKKTFKTIERPAFNQRAAFNQIKSNRHKPL